jgi:nucleotide-binding universal stress UspA family protein
MSGGPVLCAFDATEPSLLAAYAAADLAAKLATELELVFVVDHDDLPALPPHGAGIDPHVRDALPQIQEQIAEDAACEHLRAALSALPEGNVTGSVLTGLPATAIRQRAVDTGSALVVCGTAGRHGLQRLLHGSVSGSLASEAPCPVVIVPPGAVLYEPGPLLVGEDGSSHGDRALRHGEALAARLGRPLQRLHVEHGAPADALAEAARAQRAYLAVVGARGRGPWRGQVFGSVSTELVRVAGRPVMVVGEHTERFDPLAER